MHDLNWPPGQCLADRRRLGGDAGWCDAGVRAIASALIAAGLAGISRRDAVDSGTVQSLCLGTKADPVSAAWCGGPVWPRPLAGGRIARPWIDHDFVGPKGLTNFAASPEAPAVRSLEVWGTCVLAVDDGKARIRDGCSVKPSVRGTRAPKPPTCRAARPSSFDRWRRETTLVMVQNHHTTPVIRVRVSDNLDLCSAIRQRVQLRGSIGRGTKPGLRCGPATAIPGGPGGNPQRRNTSTAGPAASSTAMMILV